MTHLSLLPSDFRDSAVVYGPTFSCPSTSSPLSAPNPLSLVCSPEQRCTQELCIHRRNDTSLCYRHLELVCITSHHITSHHITPRQNTSHHVRSQHITPRQNTTHHLTSHHTSHHNTLKVLLQNVCTRSQNFTLYSLSRANDTFFYSQLK